MTEGRERIVEFRPRSFRRYPIYKDSGVEWLGEIPGHWESTTIKSLASPGYKTLVDGDWIESPYITTDGIRLIQTGNIGIGKFREKGFRYISEETFKLFRCIEIEPGDILICRLGEPVARACLAPRLGKRMITSVDVCILKLRDAADATFLIYSMSSRRYLEWVGSLVRGSTRDRVSRSMLGSFAVPFPPHAEQRTIAAFLDRETAKIDARVAKKERLIELLQEKRTALITRAVTRGLDPNVPMKDSGVAWLGEVPAHWDVAPVYARYEVALGKMLDAKRATGTSPGRYLRNVDVQWDAVNIDDLPEMDFPPPERDRYRVRPGDLLVCEGGEVGRTAMWTGTLEECFYQKALHRVRPRFESETPRFFYFLMYALTKRGVFNAGGNPNTIDHLTAIQLRHYRVAFPPRLEQSLIGDQLDRETAKIDALVAKVRTAINHLKDYRTALISAAVTGKIDVRKEAA